VGLILVLMMAGVAGCSGHPTPALTADACGLAGPELIARLAPGTGTPRSTTTPHGTFMFQSDCTTSGPAFETTDLRFRITRYGDCEEGEEVPRRSPASSSRRVPTNPHSFPTTS
jgi:hypothetical protein